MGFRSLGQKTPLEEDTTNSILAWRIPWTEEPGMLQSIGSQSRTQLSDLTSLYFMGFPGGSEGKASAYNAGDPGSTHGLGRSPGEGNGNSLQDYCLENPMDRGAW